MMILLNLPDILPSRNASLLEITAKVELDTEIKSIKADGFVGPDTLFYKDVPIQVGRTEDYDQSKRRRGKK